MKVPRHPATDRRRFLKLAGAAGAGVMLGPVARGAADSDSGPVPRVAVVMTVCTHRSHAHVILENFLNPYLFNGAVTRPGVEVAAFYVDQFPDGDLARGVSEEFGIPIFPTIAGALCLGGDELAVDGVVLIGEHGDYPVNDKAQRMYPRKRFFDETVAVFRRSGRAVPVFNDKHLSYRWDWAKEMVDVSRELGFPFLAGSSVPLAERRPPLELPAGCVIGEAVSIHGGGVESYDFHALEVLQSMVEARRGGESGIREVRFLDRDALWKAADEGLWDPELARAAMEAETGEPLPSFRGAVEGRFDNRMHGILLRYRDGLRAAALSVGGSAIRWNFACRLEGESEPRATRFHVGPWQNRNLFRALSHAIQTLIREKRAPYPVERTLLVTGALDAAMDSRVTDGRWVGTPQLAFAYEPVDFRAMREMGATWKIITEEMPEPEGFGPVGIPEHSR